MDSLFFHIVKSNTKYCYISMEYDVRMSGKFNKIIRQMPANARKTLYCLLNDIKETGPVQPAYHNYSKLGEHTYYCHLAYRWVA